ncbi:MAG: condensation domain-containing protein [bacterium]
MQDLAESPLVKLCVFDNQSNGLQYLLLISNQLVMDFRSIGLFFQDIHTICQQLEDGSKTSLPRSVKRFKNWTDRYMEEKLHREAEVCKELILAILPEIALAIDLGQTVEQQDKKTDLMFVLKKGEEMERFNKAMELAKISAEELILIAIAKSLKENGVSKVLYADCILFHTLNSLKQTDFDNVAGNLSTVFPLYLNICFEDELDKIIIMAKEEIRNFICNGEYYSIFRYMTEDKVVQEEMKQIPKPAIKFSYDGIDKIHPIYEYKEVKRHSMQNYTKEKFPYALEIDVLKINDGLQIYLTFDPSRNCHKVVQDLGTKLLEEIRNIADFILKEEKIFYVPGDFHEADWNASEMGEFLEAFSNRGD